MPDLCVDREEGLFNISDPSRFSDTFGKLNENLRIIKVLVFHFFVATFDWL